MEFSPITQIDGNDSPPPTPSQLSHPLSMLQPPSSTSPDMLVPPSTRVRSASYTLDRPKQIRRLAADTVAKNFTIQVNKNKENVNIDCNTGFYSTVAVPALHKLAASREFSCQGVTVQCQDIVGNFDATHAQQNTVVYFRFNKEKTSLGGVRIHLHHTTRRVQLQGGAMMPGEKTSPVWFTENILHEQFTELAREKAIDITNFNQTVQQMVENTSISSSPQVCAGCQGHFNGRSSPELCRQCNLFFHKFKCYPTPQHPCYQKKRSQIVTCVPGYDLQFGISGPRTTQTVARTGALTKTIQSNIATLPLTVPRPLPSGSVTVTVTPSISTSSDTGQTALNTSTVSQVQGNNQRTCDNISMGDSGAVPMQQSILPVQTTSTPGTTVSPTDQVASGSLICIPELPVTSLRPGPQDEAGPSLPPSQVTLPPGTISVLNPNAASFVRDISIVRNPPDQSQKKPKGNKKNNSVNTDPISIELEFKKVEISTLQARLQRQEVEIKDLKFRNTILMERNKILEEARKNDIHQKYFSSQDTDRSHPCPPPSQDCSNSSQGNITHQPYSQAPIIHNHYVSPTCTHQCRVGEVNGATYTNTEVIRLVGEMKDLLEKLTVTDISPPKPPAAMNSSKTSSVPTDNTQDNSATAPGEDNSIITLDGFMFNDDGSDMNLN